MKEEIIVKADTPEEMAEFLKWREWHRRGEKRGKKMYRELLSFLTNDTIPRLEAFLKYVALILDGEKKTIEPVIQEVDIREVIEVLRDLKDFITKSIG